MGSLAEALESLNCWVNLIPYNPTTIGTSNGFQAPTEEALRAFENHIRECKCKNHVGAPISVRTRFSTQGGQDVASACGQLAAAAALKSLQNQETPDLEDLMTSRKPVKQVE